MIVTDESDGSVMFAQFKISIYGDLNDHGLRPFSGSCLCFPDPLAECSKDLYNLKPPRLFSSAGLLSAPGK